MTKADVKIYQHYINGVYVDPIGKESNPLLAQCVRARGQA
jgi:hypothetical protein